MQNGITETNGKAFGIVDHNGKRIRMDSFRADGYVNPKTGYGTVDDNMVNTMFQPSLLLDRTELEALYQSNWVIGRGVELPVNDRLSKGIDFLTNDDDSENRQTEIVNLEQTIKDVKMWNHLITAEYWGRLHGGAVIYFDYGDDRNFDRSTMFSGVKGQIDKEADRTINFELKDSQRGIPNKIWVVDRFLAFPMSYYTPQVHGADHPKLGEPEIYQLTLHTTGYSRLVLAHESRLIIVDGLPLTTLQRATNQMWGNSLVQRVYDIVKYFDISLKAMADTFEDFNYKSLEIENLAELIEKEAFEEIGNATMLAAKNAHNQNIGIHGKETKLVKTSTTVTGLPDMSIIMSNYVAGSFGVPDSIFFSAKGGALGGTSALSDERNYHRKLKHEQTHRDRPHIERFIFLLGFDPVLFPFVFPPLSEATLKEQLEARSILADIDVKYIQEQVLAPEEVAVSRFSTSETNFEQTIVDFSARKEMTDDEEDTEEEESDKQPEEDKTENQRADTDEKIPLRTITIHNNIAAHYIPDKETNIKPIFKLIIKERGTANG